MKNLPLILLHEEALSILHPVFLAAPESCRTIFIWDEDYLKTRNYSFKRLVFIYETLCQMPVEIIKGKTSDVINEISPSEIFMPAYRALELQNLFAEIHKIKPVKIFEEKPFVKIPKDADHKRFFQYWNKAKKSAFETCGDIYA